MAHAAAAEAEETQYNHKRAHNTVVLMVDQEFPATGYRLDTFCPPPLKFDVADAIGL